MRRRGRRAAFAAGVAVALALWPTQRPVGAQDDGPEPALSCEGRTTVLPADLVACLGTGPVDLEGITIDGAVDLTPIGTVSQPFRCVECTFRGDVIVADVTFERLVTLERVVIEGDLDARGARFAGAVLARGRRGEPDERSGVRGDADFSLARFDEALQLDATTFDGAVSFEGARFAGSVSMSDTELFGPVNLDGVVAAETFAFDVGTAHEEVTLRNATFEGDVDLGARRYEAGLIATGTRVEGRLAIRSAVIDGDAAFDRMVVQDFDGTGLEVTVAVGGGSRCTQRDPGGRGLLDLSDLRAESITLAQAVVDELVLQGAQVVGRANLRLADLNCDASFDGLSADSLTVDLSAIERAGPAARLSMLQTVVETARASGDLELANEATYRRFVELNSDDAWPKRTLDTVFYRGVAGYMVKPARPLLALLVLLAVGTIVRVVVSMRAPEPEQRPEAGPEPGKEPEPPADDEPPTIADRIGVALGAAGWAIVRPTPKLPPGSNLLTWGSGGRLAEYLASKILLVILVIAVSNNSNALDQIVEAVLP